MAEPLAFYFDYVSPYAYLANSQLAKLGLAPEYRPIPILEVMRIVKNQPSPNCPAKLRYAMVDTARWVARYGVPFAMNQEWWSAVGTGSLTLRVFTRGALAAQQLGRVPGYHEAVFGAIWGAPRDVVSAGGRLQLLLDAGLPAGEIWQCSELPDTDADLAERGRRAAEAGVFGVPTFAIGSELFFGNDRLDFVRERAAA